MDKVVRVGISVENELLEAFDKFIAKQGYQNRSVAIRDLIRTRLEQQRLKNPANKGIAGIFLVYDHHLTDLTHRLLELQHSHLLETISSTHIHLDHYNCLEVIILKGRVGELEKIGDKLTSLKGVKLSRINIMAAE